MKEPLTTDPLADAQVVFRCDGCGQRAAGHFQNHWWKPDSWFQRSDADGAQIACSRECIDKVAERSGKTGLVLPV